MEYFGSIAVNVTDGICDLALCSFASPQSQLAHGS